MPFPPSDSNKAENNNFHFFFIDITQFTEDRQVLSNPVIRSKVTDQEPNKSSNSDIPECFNVARSMQIIPTPADYQPLRHVQRLLFERGRFERLDNGHEVYAAR
jgi:hypothetical protein